MHPLLVSAFPILFLWSQNRGEVTAADALPVLGLVVAITLVVQTLATLVLGDRRRGALVASVLALLAESYGHIWGAMLGSSAPPAWTAWLWLVLAGLVVWVIARAAFDLAPASRIVTVMAAVMVVFAVVPIGASELSRAGTDGSGPTAQLTTPTGAPARDIYYIILDRYGREDALEDVFGYDNRPFVSGLEDAGFDVADASIANYPKTAHSLSASLNLDYLDDLAATDPPGADWAPVYATLRDNELGKILTGAGYDYLHLGSWFSPTSKADSATSNVLYSNTSEFAETFASTTIWPQITASFGDEDEDFRSLVRNWSLFQLDKLEELATQPHDTPRYVFVHITLPHEPYVFEADGSLVTEETADSRTRNDNYVRHLRYINGRMDRIVDLLTSKPDDQAPIVVIQADEGPTPEARVAAGPKYDWTAASDAQLREKLQILNAYYLPGLDASPVYEDISPVNTWRMLLNAYFGTDYERLPDRAFIFPDETELYDYIDVTDRVR